MLAGWEDALADPLLEGCYCPSSTLPTNPPARNFLPCPSFPYSIWSSSILFGQFRFLSMHPILYLSPYVSSPGPLVWVFHGRFYLVLVYLPCVSYPLHVFWKLRSSGSKNGAKSLRSERFELEHAVFISKVLPANANWQVPAPKCCQKFAQWLQIEKKQQLRKKKESKTNSRPSWEPFCARCSCVYTCH